MDTIDNQQAAPGGRETFAQLRRRVAQQSAVAELGRLALTGTDLCELFDEAVRRAAAGLGTELAAILQLDEETGMLTCRASVGWTADMIRPVTPTQESQIGCTFLTTEPIVVDDLDTETRFPASRHLLELGLTSGASVIVRGEARPCGVLAVHSRLARTFTGDDVLFLRGIANVVAAASARDEAARARERSDRRLALLADASHALARSLELDTTMEALARLVVPQLADWCIVHLLEGPRIVPVAVAHADPVRAAEARVWSERFPLEPDMASVPAEVMRTGRAALVRQIDDELLRGMARGEEHLQLLRDARLKSAMVAPLSARGETLGAITFLWAESGGRYDDADLALAEELGRRAGLAIDNAHSHEAELAARRRAERLQRVTARLAQALTPGTVYEVVLGEGVASCDAALGLVALVDGDGEQLRIAAAHGYTAELVDRWRTFPVGANYPLSEAVRTGEAVYCLSLEERDRRYPGMGNLDWADHSVVCLPLPGSDGPLGGLVLSFAEEREFPQDEREFLAALATQCGQALERARLAAALTHEREQLRTVLDQMPSGVLIAASDGRIVLRNAQLDRIWGAAGPDERPLARALAGEVVASEPVVSERPDGGRRISNVSAAPVRNAAGEIAAAVVVFSDMTAEYTAREEAERRADAAHALAFVADGVCLVDRESVVRLWNDAAVRMTGLRDGDVVGRPLGEALPGWDAVAHEVPTTLAGETPSRSATLPFELPEGERWLSVAGVAFDDGVVYAFRDVTEERQLDTLKSDFIATVSHELRTPLAAIYGAAATLRQRPGLDPEERQQFLAMIGEQAERLSGIVNEILVASRLESGLLPVTLGTVDPVEVAKQVLDVARRGAPEFSFELHAEPHVPPVLADADRLRQVLGNLLENAQKYSDGSTSAELHVGESAGRVRFVVRDYGIGVPPGDRERIFEKFYRVDAAMTTGVSGTGLGLYIVRELVRRMDGRVHVEPGGERGSAFVVELPSPG